MRRAALAGGLLVLALGVVAFVHPFMTRERDFLTTTPQPRPLDVTELVELSPGEQACLDEAVLDEHSERALIRVGTYGRPASSPLRLDIAGPGYREVARVPPTYVDGVAVGVPIARPSAPVVATVCVRNDGRARIALFAGADRTTRSHTVVGGMPVAPNFEISFAEGERHSLLERLPLTIERMQAFRPDAPWLAWLILVLLVIGVPLAAVWAYAAAAHDDEERGGTGSQVPSTLDEHAHRAS